VPIDVVVVAYRSGACLRGCVEPLSGVDGVRVFVADNGCPDDSTATVADLPLEIVRMGSNRGFAAACNAAAKRGDGEAILFLNPDARIGHDMLGPLVRAARAGAGGPLVRNDLDQVDCSVRRDPRLRSTFAEAFLLHHLFPERAWATELVRDAYDVQHSAEWLSGAALCVDRAAFERVGGFDERFFLYSEDADLCRRLRGAGFTITFEPAAVARHQGGASAPKPGQAALKAHARIRYVRIHERGLRYGCFRVGFVVYELIRVPIALARSRTELHGRIASLLATLGVRPELPPSRPAAATPRTS
jgi:N-acetylglucosaminyl-diphospho-decaprenol L-rhamnosyltransferase